MNHFDSSTVVCCSDIQDPQWRWIAAELADTGVKFEFARCVPRYTFEANDCLNFARIRGSFEAVQLARRRGACVLVAHGPAVAAWCALFSRAYRLRIPIVAHTFNFTELPSPAKRRVFAVAFSKVSRFVVFSTMERALYSRAFGLPADRFDVVLWGVRPPDVDAPEQRFEPGPYVCSIGGNARDYATLVEAARQLPDIRFVLVVRPNSLIGLDLPPNVAMHTNIPFGQAMNVLLHSQFMVLPLVGSEVPCGHVTLVAAMHLGKTFVITASAGVSDYVRNHENALTATVGSVESLVAAIRQLWADPALCARLGENGRIFAARECNQERTVAHFRSWLKDNIGKAR